MEPDKLCTSLEKHHGHICFLRSRGGVSLDEIRTDNPAVSCAICGVEADSEDNVCSPVPL